MTGHLTLASEELEPTDQDMVSSLAQGQVAALEVLYERYSVLAFSLAYRMLRDRGSAEEAVQDSFVALWRNAARYDAERGTVRSWLLRIVRNRCIDRLRMDLARPRSAGSEHLLAQPGAAETSAEAFQQLTGEEIRCALDILPSEQRQAIELAYFGDCTQQEIAQRLNIPLGTVKGRLRLGLRRLRRLLTVTGAEVCA